MRDFKGMKRQRGRNRSAGGKPQQHNANRALESNGPEGVKVRGNAQTVYERYQQLARDAGSAGDRVLAENFLQHAEHYFRLIRAMQPTRPAAEIIGRDQFISGFDVDFEDESGEAVEAETTESEAEPRDRNGWRDRDDRRDRFRDRDERPREDRPREDRPREDRARDERPREERQRDDRPGRDPLPVIEPSGGVIAPATDRAPSPTLRSEDGAESQAPDFLRPRPPRAEPEGEEARPPRRRRAPRSFAGDEGQGGED